MKFIISIFSFLIVLACLQPAQLAAQTMGTSARLSGMGNSSAALVRGVDAVSVNPALINPGKGIRFSIGVLPFGSDMSTDFFDYATYQRYFTGQINNQGKTVPYYLTSEDKDVIINNFPGETGAFRHDIQYSFLTAIASFSIGTLGFSISERTGSNITLPRSFAEFMLNGNPPGVAFDFSATRISSSWTRQYAMSYAYQYKYSRATTLSIGGSAKYIHGYGYFALERFNSNFTTDPDSFVVTGTADMLATYAGTNDWISNNSLHYSLFPSPVGTGWGFDLGAHMQVTNSFSAGISMLDIGSVTWDRNARRITASEDFRISDLSSEEQVDEIKQRLNGTEEEIEQFTSALPTAFVVAGVYSFQHFIRKDKYLHLTFAVRQGLNNESGNSTSPRVGLGTEFELLRNVAFRLGVNFGGIQPMAVAAGIGFIADNFKLDIGSMDISPTMTDSFSTVTFGVSTHIDI